MSSVQFFIYIMMRTSSIK